MIAASNESYGGGHVSGEERLVFSHRSCTFCILLLLGLDAALMGWSAWVHSPTHLELFHLPAGVTHLRLHRFDLYRVNPPLVRMMAALPVEYSGFRVDCESHSATSLNRAEFPVGLDCMYANDVRVFWLTTLARWACIPFVLLGGWVCFLWARSLYGSVAGIVALLLWCFCPYVLGHGSLITPDAHAAGVGIAASFLFWHWLKSPKWKRALAAGVVLGFAELTKFTLLVFYPLWVALWAVYRFTDRAHRSVKQCLSDAAMMLAMVSLSILIINLGYEFEGSFRPLGNYRFQSCWLTGVASHDNIPEGGGNRFSDSWLAGVPVPLPANFVQGIDMQRKDFEKGIYSYLRGKWQVGGWWYFHLYALCVKLPLGTWFLVLLAVVLFLSHAASRASWRDEMVLIAPIVVMLVLVCSHSGIGIHSRYTIPVLPFVFVWMSKIARVFKMRPLTPGRRVMAAMMVVALTWSVGSSLWAYPHSLGYFNELIGGPKNGFRHLAKSDSSWGQDLLFLKQWVNGHPEARSLRIAHCGPFDPRLAGFEFTLPPVGPREKNHLQTLPIEELGPKPGWYAIDVCFLLGGDPLSASDGQGGWDEPSKKSGYDLSYFLHFRPVASAGYSIYIYHVTPEEANHMRRELGLPELKRP